MILFTLSMDMMLFSSLASLMACSTEMREPPGRMTFISMPPSSSCLGSVSLVTLKNCPLRFTSDMVWARSYSRCSARLASFTIRMVRLVSTQYRHQVSHVLGKY